MTPRLRLLIGLASLIFFIAHVRALPRTLEDIDSINFAMGVEHFDVAAHQPHPPGYPVYIAMARASTRALAWIEPSWDRDRRAAAGLSVWGLIAGTCALWVVAEFWTAVGLMPTVAFFAALVAVMSPLFWFTAARPLSDTPALVLSLAVATGLFRGWRMIDAGGANRLPRVWIVSAVAAGLIIGIRSQTIWLTGPLLCWVAGELVARRRVGDALRLVAAAAAGALLWAIPLVMLTGGVQAYLVALGRQGTQDFSGIEMLATTPTWKLFRAALAHTFVEPWQAAALANVVLGLALAGVVRLVWGGRRVLAALLLVFWPYLVFHLTFHETLTLRYALPLVVPVAGLAVIALSLLGSRVMMTAGTAAAVWSLVVVQPRLLAYANDGAPVFRAFQDMQAALPSTSPPPVLRMHHQVFWGIRRVTDWYRPSWDVGPLSHPGSREWLDVVRHFASGDDRPVWFLSDVTRNDLAQFDGRERRVGGHYLLSPEIRQLVGGARLDSLDWQIIDRPRWMLGAGWSLTPEIAGMTDQDGTSPSHQPVEAFLRRSPQQMHVMIGGRLLEVGESPSAVVSVELGGRPLDQFTVSRASPWFVRWIDLPKGIPNGPTPYERLVVRAASAVPGLPAPAIGLEQFDAVTEGTPIFAYEDGWHELEEDPATGRLWRWTSARSLIQIKDWGPSVSVVLTGESPLRYFPSPPTVIVRAGETEVGRFLPPADFTRTITIPAAALNASSGQVSIETNMTFSPAERHQSADQRRLGLRLYGVQVK
ncbi:MAG TPA: hypothetical protein VLT86_18335 [Vicinamibacterales bacterium]|nr:hypothetical protein [Vicinamibacterales bacterium]